MKRSVQGIGAVAVAVAIILLASGTLEATQFTMSSASLTLQSTDPGLVIEWSLIDESLPWTFTLEDVGDSVTRKLFRVGTTEVAINDDDEVWKPAAADFAFSAPPGISGDAVGQSVGDSILDGLIGWGAIDWRVPALVDFGAFGALSIRLYDLKFGAPGFVDQRVTVTMTRARVAEPSTLLLVALGLGAGWLGRRARPPLSGARRSL